MPAWFQGQSMIVGGFSYVGTLSRQGAPTPTWLPAEAESEDEAIGMSEHPTYFRTLSSISPGSFAAAYKAIRTQESAMPGEGLPDEPAGEPAILSGLGIPGAMSAYAEVMGVGAD